MLIKNKTNLNKDLGQYRKFILNFIAKNKQSIIYPCKNSYHRMLVHQFCDQQNLNHETIINGYKMVRGCCRCHSTNIDINKDGYGEYYCRCLDCNYSTVGYNVVKNFTSKVEIDLKAIRISKK